jgi:hypothetical protein
VSGEAALLDDAHHPHSVSGSANKCTKELRDCDHQQNKKNKAINTHSPKYWLLDRRSILYIRECIGVSLRVDLNSTGRNNENRHAIKSAKGRSDRG